MKRVYKRTIIVLGLMVFLLLSVSAYAAKLSDLPYGTVLSDGTNKWVVYTAGATTRLIAQKSVGNLPYDAAEPSHAGFYNGDTDFTVSNLRQWLNAVGLNWYTPQTAYDVAPTYATSQGYKGTLPAAMQRAIQGAVEIPDYEPTQTWMPYNGSFSTITGSTQCQPEKTSIYMDLGETQFSYVGTMYVMFHAMTWCNQYFPDGMVEMYNGTGYTVTHNYNYLTETAPPTGYTFYMLEGKPCWVEDRGATYHYPLGTEVGQPSCLEYASHAMYGLYSPKQTVVPTSENIYTKDANIQYINGRQGKWVTSVQSPSQAAAIYPVITVDGTLVEVLEGNVMDFNQPPTAPSGVAVSGKVHTQGESCTVTVADGVTDPDNDIVSYKFELSSDDGVNWTALGTTNERTIAYTVPNSIASYKVRVQAVDTNGAGSDYAVTDNIDIVLNAAPPAPTSVILTGNTAVAGSLCHAQASEECVDPDGDEVTYEFEISNNESGTWALLGNSASREVTYTLPPTGVTSYQVRVRAVDSGNRASAYTMSAVISVAANTPPTTATTVEANGVRAGSVATAYCTGIEDGEGDTINYIWELAGSDGNYEQVGNTLVPNMKFAVPTVGDTYKVRVKGVDIYGSEGAYAESEAYTIVHNNAPSNPTEVTATGDAVGTQSTATVTPCTDADGDSISYVWDCQINGVGWLNIGRTVEPILDYTVPVGENYQLRVKAVDQYGAESAYTESAVVTLIDNTYPGAPVINKNNGWTDDPSLEINPADASDPNFDVIMYKIERLD